MKITYTQQGDYLIPDIKVDAPSEDIGHYGWMRFHYLKDYKEKLYWQLFYEGRLWEHLLEVNRSARALHELISRQLTEERGITEDLKRKNQMEWVQQMMQVRATANEIVQAELIYC